ncbi:alpha/beta hydrolase [Luteipulveratus mongoliensis]|uniref:Alpha/beta hydrolase n=1 Tax=Luteipulveratus mongoliensis TaxID=571913 RepID=A0A0K1JD87_9MICO|nr:alpha/beta hydrolase [Luteipulveratus mongoliensis]AKU14677.1 alpha/beta hydrolase [Luteipulveratus mongoliensis]
MKLPYWARAAQAALAGIGRLPLGVQQRLGGRPVRIDGQQLHAELQFPLRLVNATSKRAHDDTAVQEGRELLAFSAALFGGKPAPVDLESVTIPSPRGSINARLYRPAGRRPARLLVYFHGGGWVLGGLDDDAEPLCAFLAEQADVTVLSVDYRLAPEHRFPAAAEDAVSAYRWAVAQTASLGIDPSAIAVGGISAGGNLAAVVSQAVAGEDLQQPVLQVLVVPVTDVSTKHRSYELFGEGFALTEADMDWFKDTYLNDPEEALDPRVSPLLTDDLSGLPPAYVAVAGFDPLRDEGIAYAERLREAGVPTELRVHTGLIHSFAGILGVGRAGRAAAQEIADAIRQGFDK